MSEKIEISIPTAEEFVENIKHSSSKDIQTEFIGRIVIIIIAGLGLISVLAWDEALKDFYKEIVKNSESLAGKFGYAIVITLLSVIVSIILTRAFMKNKIKHSHK
jgi:hypothetical protein